jgi:hypothetical protein
MKGSIATLAIAALVATSFGLMADVSVAKDHGAYAQKKAECKQEAKSKRFGIHWMKRDRWVKNCIAGHRAEATQPTTSLAEDFSAHRHPRHSGWIHGRHLGWRHSHHSH